MQRSLVGRLEALEQRPCFQDQGPWIVRFVSPGGSSREAVAYKDVNGWRCDREPGEDAAAFHERACSTCPRPMNGVAVLVEVGE
jgi:hypothetical protein